MSAKSDDLSRIQEIHDVITQTKEQIKQISFSKERFANPKTAQDDLIAEGIMNRVFRVAEEAGKLSDAVIGNFGIERRSILGVRNRLAHAYGDVDKDIVWAVLENDFEDLLEACQDYCDEQGIDLA